MELKAGIMKKKWPIVALALAVIILSVTLSLMVQPQSEFIKIIELIKNPDKFDNKVVEIKGTIIDIAENFEENLTSYYIDDGSGRIYATALGRPLLSVGENVIVRGVFCYIPTPSYAQWMAFIYIQEVRKIPRRHTK